MNEIELYDAFGRNLKIIEGSQTLDLSEYNPGIYLIRIPKISNRTFKIVKQ